MKRILDFIKKFGSALYDLCIAEGRWMQIMVGGIITIVMMAVIAIWTPYNPIPLQCCCGATVSVLITMLAMSFASKAYTGNFSWKNVFAGMLAPIVIDIIIVIMLLCK